MPTVMPTQNNQAADMSEVVKDVEKDLLFHIVANMKDKKITVEKAHLLAKEFTDLLPMKDKEDLLNKLLQLSKTHQEAREVYVKYGFTREDEKRDEILNMVRDHIKNGDIEKAIDIVKGGNNNG